MGLLSIFRSRVDAGAAGSGVGEPVDAVQRARTRARQRLIGAVVLVVTGVVGFPLVFETQPRPVPVDIPIEIPRKDLAPALVMPAARLPGAAGATSVNPGTAGRGDAGASAPALPVVRTSPPLDAKPAPKPAVASPRQVHDDVITELRDEVSRSVAPVAAGSRGATAGPSRQASAPVAVHAPVAPRSIEAPVAASPKATPAPPTRAAAADGARAKALLEGIDAAPANPLRFVVQIGAFADAGVAHETRSKVEKIGLKTYTQTAQTPAGPRIRIRLGPFATRDEAVKAQGRAHSAGLSAVVLAL